MEQTGWQSKLGEAIAGYRRRRGLTQQEAADRYGCSLRWWQTIEGGRNLSVAVLLRIARILRVEAWNLLKW